MDVVPRIRSVNAPDRHDVGRYVLRHRVHDCRDFGRGTKALSFDSAFFRARTSFAKATSQPNNR